MLGDLGEATLIRISDHEIRHCLGCRECMKIMRCAIRDDEFEQVFEEWNAADVLILGAPVYWLGPPGAMKDFIDRSHGVYARRAKPFAGKKAAIISVAADSGFQTHERILTTWLRHYGAEIVGQIRLLAREKDDLIGNPSELRKLDQFVRRIKGRLQPAR
jgi:multimeric flavodoxin WrbA